MCGTFGNGLKNAPKPPKPLSVEREKSRGKREGGGRKRGKGRERRKRRKRRKEGGIAVIFQAEVGGYETVEKYTIFRFFTMWISLFNKYECIYGTTYK